ncbi:uncharacterized protein LOC131831109 [Mustela lutreola]|uniref:uncharacterized protein LOC131831109 n=1 Tax=Mustela lutreola TaxID=9666 RepID=UPI0027970C1C|nr:uncharacterized protein LOC131831109 [Mustela lutreola]
MWSLEDWGCRYAKKCWCWQLEIKLVITISWAQVMANRKIPTPDFVIATRGKYQDRKEEQILERVSLRCGLSLSRAPNIGTKPFKNRSAGPTVSRGGGGDLVEPSFADLQDPPGSAPLRLPGQVACRTSGHPLSQRHACTWPRTQRSCRRPSGQWRCCRPSQCLPHQGEPGGLSQYVQAAALPGALIRPPEHNSRRLMLTSRGHTDLLVACRSSEPEREEAWGHCLVPATQGMITTTVGAPCCLDGVKASEHRVACA